MTKTRAEEWARKVAPYALVIIPVLVLAKITIGAVYKRVGHAGATLDDAYIHFQYARAIAEGHPLRYHAGEPVTTGATSLLWPLALAPLWLLGLRGDLLVWPCWVLSFAALAGLAWEARALAEPLCGRAIAMAAGAMVLSFSAFTWCAGSGMEIMPFAWAIARGLRRSAETASGSPAPVWELTALAWVSALIRPEGAVVALVIGAVTFARRSRALGALAAVSAFAPSFVSWIATGSLRSQTAQVKLLWGNPYFMGGAFWDQVAANVRTFFGTLLNGEVWSAEFVPQGMGFFFAFGMICVVVQGARTKKHAWAAAVLLLAAMMLIPTTYVTFLWNRLRYLWPFATGWIVGLACLARVVGDALGELSPRYRVAGPILAGAAVGAFAQHLPWTIDDVASSASGIARQQATLGRWAREHLPKDARVGVNDTGAIAYFGERPTFDIVGLTTRGEGRYWVAGVASRVEHYERMRRENPAALPTHFIVYPDWMGTESLLGEMLQEAIVTDSSILGGQVMRAHVADYALLGSGEMPWTATPPPRDALDVADLESEADHGYELLGARDNSQVVKSKSSPYDVPVLDGGRAWRTRERFVADVGKRVIVRLEASGPTTVTLFIEGENVSERHLEGGDWDEIWFDVAPEKTKRAAHVELRASSPVTTFHYWFF